MSIKKMLKSKNALSPILASLPIIVIAVASIVVAYMWSIIYLGTTTQQVTLHNKSVIFHDHTTEIVRGREQKTRKSYVHT
jgi:hypothetical protein